MLTTTSANWSAAQPAGGVRANLRRAGTINFLRRQIICSLRSIAVLLFLVTASSLLDGHAALAQSHVLQLDTGGHQGDIKDVIFTRDGAQIVSAGDDKVI